MTNDSIRTAIRDAVLAGVSAECTDEQVQGIEWGAIEDTIDACTSAAHVTDEYGEKAVSPLPYFETYHGVLSL